MENAQKVMQFIPLGYVFHSVSARYYHISANTWGREKEANPFGLLLSPRALFLGIHRRRHFCIFFQQFRCAGVVAHIPVHGSHPGHFFRSQREIKQVKVFFDMVRVFRPGNDNIPILHMPAQFASSAKSGSFKSVLSPCPSGYHACMLIPSFARNAFSSFSCE